MQHGCFDLVCIAHRGLSTRQANQSGTKMRARPVPRGEKCRLANLFSLRTCRMQPWLRGGVKFQCECDRQAPPPSSNPPLNARKFDKWSQPAIGLVAGLMWQHWDAVPKILP